MDVPHGFADPSVAKGRLAIHPSRFAIICNKGLSDDGPLARPQPQSGPSREAATAGILRTVSFVASDRVPNTIYRRRHPLPRTIRTKPSDYNPPFQKSHS